MSQDKREMQYTAVDELELSGLRDVRQNVVDQIKERIEQDGYDPARPMRVLENGDGYVVADGNHRLQALRELHDENMELVPEQVPTVVEKDADIVAVSVEANENESTFAEQDLFDYLDYIDQLREEGHTQVEIAERLGWSRSKASQYTTLLNNIATTVLAVAKRNQKGRVAPDATNVANYSEGWFRNSGIYKLNREGTEKYAKPGEEEPIHAQMRVMRWFCEDQNCDATKNAVQNKVDEILEKCELLDIVGEQLEPSVNDEKREEIREEVIKGVYTKDTIDGPIENANKQAQNRAVYGEDARDVLPGVESDSIDCVIADPPYGIDFENVRPTENPSFDDSGKNAFDLLDSVLAEVKNVAKANAHIYLFFSMTEYERVKEIASKYFEVDATPLIWAKNNHTPNAPGSGGFDKNYAQQYEPVLWCKMPNGDQRELNGGVSPNVLNHNKPNKEERYHQTQKPRSLLRELIKNSTGKGEQVLDPFAGSGSTLLAAKELGRHYLGVEVDATLESDFKRELNGVESDE